jgi:protein-S-isoprenylcysteine O-methyltransferase Ste14
VLWVIFSLYWGIAGLNSAPTKSSESWASTSFHQFMLGVALLLLILTVPGLNGRFLPERLHFLVVAGAIVQAGFLLLAVWARRHLGRNWSAEVRIAMDHQLIRTGPYRFLRHPIYTAMLGMFLGTAIASGQVHALIGLALLVVAYLRKTWLEDQILAQTFGAEFDAYRMTHGRWCPCCSNANAPEIGLPEIGRFRVNDGLCGSHSNTRPPITSGLPTDSSTIAPVRMLQSTGEGATIAPSRRHRVPREDH